MIPTAYELSMLITADFDSWIYFQRKYPCLCFTKSIHHLFARKNKFYEDKKEGILYQKKKRKEEGLR